MIIKAKRTHHFDNTNDIVNFIKSKRLTKQFKEQFGESADRYFKNYPYKSYDSDLIISFFINELCKRKNNIWVISYVPLFPYIIIIELGEKYEETDTV